MLNLSCAGNVGRDAETRKAGDTTVTGFSVAVSGYDFKARQKTATWVRVSVWGRRGETLCPLLTKGSKVAVSGEMTLSEYNGKTSIEIKAQDVTLLGGGGDRGGAPKGGSPPAPEKESFGDDDVPF